MKSNSKVLELYHRNGKKYKITNIPLFDPFLLNLHLQKFIDEIDQQLEPNSTYSFHNYLLEIENREIY